jgi:hypothetical protein
MEIKELETKVKTELTKVGLLFNDTESIFSNEKMVIVEDKGVNLLSPTKKVLMSINSHMNMDDANKIINSFISYIKRDIKDGRMVTLNPNITVSEFFGNVAKLFGKTLPKDGSDVKLTDLIG